VWVRGSGRGEKWRNGGKLLVEGAGEFRTVRNKSIGVGLDSKEKGQGSSHLGAGKIESQALGKRIVQNLAENKRRLRKRDQNSH